MLRFLLAIAGIGLIVVGLMYQTEQIPAKGNWPERITLADILTPAATGRVSMPMAKKAEVPDNGNADNAVLPEPPKHYRYPAYDRVSPHLSTTRDWNSYVHINGVEVEPTPLAPADTTSTYRYAPVKGTQDQLYLLVNSYDKLPAGPFTVVGYFVRESPTRLPQQLASLVDNKQRVFLLTYETKDYLYRQSEMATTWMLPGGVLLAIAVVWQVVSMVMSRQLLGKLDAATEEIAAPCAICQETSQRVPIYLSTERRRIVGYAGANLAKVERATHWVHISVCRKCYPRLKKLTVVSSIAMCIAVFLLFGLLFGIAMMFVGPPDAKLMGTIALGVSVAIAVLTWAWMTWRFKRILGPQLFQEFKLSSWNPMASKFEYGITHVSNSETK